MAVFAMVACSDNDSPESGGSNGGNSGGDKAYITISHSEFNVSAEGETIAVEVKSNVGLDVTISSDVDWIVEGTKSSDTYYFDIIANDTYIGRMAEITFANNENNISEKVTISQKAENLPANTIFYTSSDNNIVTPYKIDAFDATIVSNIYEEGVGGIITFDKGITKIGQHAFSNCSTLTNIVIPNGVISIENVAFYGCKKLVTATIPDSVTSVGERIFIYCNELVSFYGKFASADGRCLIVDGELKAVAPANLTSYNIPTGVTSIGDFLFSQTKLTSVTIPNGVTSIGNNAFSQMALTSVEIPNSVMSIGEEAFGECYNLTSVTIPDSVTWIGEGAFNDCSKLKAFYGKFASPDNSCLIVDGVLIAFAGKDRGGYTIPDNVTRIGAKAFCSCNNIESVYIPDCVTSIGEMTFYNCRSLSYIVIPDGVTSIEYATFYGCRSLTKMILPESITSIHSNAFTDCSSVVNIYCKPVTPPDLYLVFYTFKGLTSLQNIYVPTTSVDAYKAADGWKDYADIIVGYDFTE